MPPDPKDMDLDFLLDLGEEDLVEEPEAEAEAPVKGDASSETD